MRLLNTLVYGQWYSSDLTKQLKQHFYHILYGITLLDSF